MQTVEYVLRINVIVGHPEALSAPAAGGWNFPISQIFVQVLIQFASLQRTPDSLHLIMENPQLCRLTDCGLSMSWA